MQWYHEEIVAFETREVVANTARWAVQPISGGAVSPNL